MSKRPDPYDVPAGEVAGAVTQAKADVKRLHDEAESIRSQMGDPDDPEGWPEGQRTRYDNLLVASGHALDDLHTLEVRRKDHIRAAAANPGNRESERSRADSHGRMYDQPAAQNRADGLPSLAPDAATVSTLHRAVTEQTNVRAAVVTSDTGADQFTSPLGGAPRPGPRRLLAFANVPGIPVSGVESASFPVFGDGDAGITAEGALKTEYDAITPGSATPQMISIWTDYSRQILLTVSTFEAKLRGVLAAKVARREDQLIITTALGTTGIQTLDHSALTVPPADSLLQAAALVSDSEVAAPADVFVLNPADVPRVFGESVGTGGSASPDFGSLDLRIHGMRGYVSGHVASGTVLVGAWAASATAVWGLQPTYLVDATSQLKNNIVTTLLEEAVALAVDEPTGMCQVTLSP